MALFLKISKHFSSPDHDVFLATSSVDGGQDYICHREMFCVEGELDEEYVRLRWDVSQEFIQQRILEEYLDAQSDEDALRFGGVTKINKEIRLQEQALVTLRCRACLGLLQLPVRLPCARSLRCD